MKIRCLILSLLLLGNFSKAEPVNIGNKTLNAPNFSSKVSINSNFYVLGPGDTVLVELLDVPEFTGTFTIGPDGILYLPRLRSLYVEGLTVEELKQFLNIQFSNFVKYPEVYVKPVIYRPVRVYIGGEVYKPGYYYLTGENSLEVFQDVESNFSAETTPYSQTKDLVRSPVIEGIKQSKNFRLPTVFDALRIAGGVTPHSKLSDVIVTRNRPLGDGGGKIKANINFLNVITQGDNSQNIRLLDGDSIFVSRSEKELREQIIKASQTNLSPDYMSVFVSGRVRSPGQKILRQGGTLDQALASAGGQKILRGNVEFIRFDKSGKTDKRTFFYSSAAEAGSFKNPVLMQGDIIRVNDSPLSATLSILNEFTVPALGVYSVFNLFQ